MSVVEGSWGCFIHQSVVTNSYICSTPTPHIYSTANRRDIWNPVGLLLLLLLFVFNIYILAVVITIISSVRQVVTNDQTLTE